MSLYDLMYADQDLDQILSEAEFAPGSDLDVARARMWEGNAAEAAALAATGPEPWASFVVAGARMRDGNPNAKRPLVDIAEDVFRDARSRLWAWTALRKLGEKPSKLQGGEVIGFVLIVPTEGSADALAAYADGSVRFVGYAEQLVIRDPAKGEPDAKVTDLIAQAHALVALPPQPRPKDEKLPPPDKVRMSALTAHGIHTAEVPWSEVEAGGKYEALFVAATKLLEAITA